MVEFVKRSLVVVLLLFTLPRRATSLDDGLLTASEIAALKLNADWVVMSACNTASGDKPGAKTLLVSHWPVYSDAATTLTTNAFAQMRQAEQNGSPTGRAQALQRSMLALMNDKSQTGNAHPAVWAPFVVVGEGSTP